jgi:glycine/D-amino acid oxidase-like deaminating enzyme
MNTVNGNPLWSKLNTIPNKYTYLSENVECEVVIVGGGITGAICAYYLSEAGVKTVLVDKNIIGYGSTKASTSILQYEIDTDLYLLQKSIGEEKALRAFQLCEKAVFDIETMINSLDDNCDFRFTECLYYTSKENEIELMRKEFDVRKSLGFDVEFIDETIGKSRFSFPIKAGIYSRKGVAEIDPYRLTHALLRKAVSKGLVVFENTEIVNFDTANNKVVLSCKNAFTIKAKKAIIATGYEATQYIKEKISSLTRSFTVTTKPVQNFNGWYNQCIIRDTANPYTYLRTTPDNRILIGGEDLAVGSADSKMMNLSDNDEIVCKDKYKKLLDRLKAYFPDITDIDPEFTFNGLFADTKDSLPYIGEYDPMPNCYFCLGYGSNGILYNVFGAQIILDLLKGKSNPDIDLFKFGR